MKTLRVSKLISTRIGAKNTPKKSPSEFQPRSKAYNILDFHFAT